jgi:hypothetical protein
VFEEPQLFEARDVPEVPNDRAHEHVVLLLEIAVAQSTYEQERSRTGILQLGL